MSGHNKWSKVKHKKAVTDAVKSKIFGKLARLIALESKKAGGDENAPGLRAVIEKAKQSNMPRENIDRAIKKGAGGEGDEMESIQYETYGPSGAAIVIDALTDNRNRTASEIKHILTKNSLALAAPGSASWAFTKTTEGWSPHTTIEIQEKDKEKLEELVEQLEESDDVQEVHTNAA